MSKDTFRNEHGEDPYPSDEQMIRNARARVARAERRFYAPSRPPETAQTDLAELREAELELATVRQRINNSKGIVGS